MDVVHLEFVAHIQSDVACEQFDVSVFNYLS
jgi:hypothetical protein